MPIRFFSEDTRFSLPHPRKTSHWIRKVIQTEKRAPGDLNFIFSSDDYVREINIQYLNHKTYTDIITFDTSEGDDRLSGDIYISIDRVKENALKFQFSFDEELHRVIIHGVLHLLGFSDKSSGKRLVMRRKENAYLSLR